MEFGYAFESMKKDPGKIMRLPHWGKDVMIQLQVPDEHSKMTHPYLYVESDKGLVPWNPTVPEMFSDDWVIVEKEGYLMALVDEKERQEELKKIEEDEKKKGDN